MKVIRAKSHRKKWYALTLGLIATLLVAIPLNFASATSDSP